MKKCKIPQFNQNELKQLQDEELIELLFIHEDRVPRSVVEEFMRRGRPMIKPLWDIIAEINYWTGPTNKYWAVIHATYIIGAIGGREAITPLIMSLKFAGAYDYDWITEHLSAMFGRIGEPAIEPLKKVAADKSNDWMIRTIALEGLAAVTLKASKYKMEIFDFIASFLKSDNEDLNVRGIAGSILLDFQLDRYKQSLIEFAKLEQEIKNQDFNYYPNFDGPAHIAELFNEKNNKRLELYQRDWLEFYNQKEIEQRQKRWKRERSWWRRRLDHLIFRLTFEKSMKKLKEEMEKDKEKNSSE